ncbi:MAG: hypothetical protein SFY80_10560 [Verrucomicrobiota bacterium]|nr:hypothetical protein [Verrucomicrobiota bacterium]
MAALPCEAQQISYLNYTYDDLRCKDADCFDATALLTQFGQDTELSKKIVLYAEEIKAWQQPRDTPFTSEEAERIRCVWDELKDARAVIEELATHPHWDLDYVQFLRYTKSQGKMLLSSTSIRSMTYLTVLRAQIFLQDDEPLKAADVLFPFIQFARSYGMTAPTLLDGMTATVIFRQVYKEIGTIVATHPDRLILLEKIFTTLQPLDSQEFFIFFFLKKDLLFEESYMPSEIPKNVLLFTFGEPIDESTPFMEKLLPMIRNLILEHVYLDYFFNKERAINELRWGYIHLGTLYEYGLFDQADAYVEKYTNNAHFELYLLRFEKTLVSSGLNIFPKIAHSSIKTKIRYALLRLRVAELLGTPLVEIDPYNRKPFIRNKDGKWASVGRDGIIDTTDDVTEEAER